ncbi:MAG: hypothetical protein FJ295_13670 [Planctomycetes bacterium]|nr:hypothetical protein [Planctomycetota bacterium]
MSSLDRAKSNMLRFAILRHDLDDGSFHFDWMFESQPGSPLRTWSVPELADPGMEFRGPCRRLDDHRAVYLDYQGPLTGQRGAVTRIDQGEFRLLVDLPDYWHAALTGTRIRGTVEFVAQNQVWRMAFVPD